MLALYSESTILTTQELLHLLEPSDRNIIPRYSFRTGSAIPEHNHLKHIVESYELLRIPANAFEFPGIPMRCYAFVPPPYGWLFAAVTNWL